MESGTAGPDALGHKDSAACGERAPGRKKVGIISAEMH